MEPLKITSGQCRGTFCHLRNHWKSRIGRKVKYLDTCIAPVVEAFNDKRSLGQIGRTLACCCGHGIYHPTIFYINKKSKIIFEYFSGQEVKPMKRRYKCFYQRDVSGFYFNQQIEDFYTFGKNVVN